MKEKSVRIGCAVALAGALFVILAGLRSPSSAGSGTLRVSIDPPERVSEHALLDRPEAPAAGQPIAPAPSVLSAEAKAALVARINRDYDAIRLALLAENAAHREAAGDAHAFGRQLDLLERERRKDLAAVLTSRELEDLELRESPAGHLVTHFLGGTNASEEQRRAVFRLQRAFELAFDGSRPPSPELALEREQARQWMQEQIRAVLGDDLFGSWGVGSGELYTAARVFAARHSLPAQVANELRHAHYDYRLKAAALRATASLPANQLAAAKSVLTKQSEARVKTLLGPVLYQTARAELLNWLPREGG